MTHNRWACDHGFGFTTATIHYRRQAKLIRSRSTEHSISIIQHWPPSVLSHSTSTPLPARTHIRHETCDGVTNGASFPVAALVRHCRVEACRSMLPASAFAVAAAAERSTSTRARVAKGFVRLTMWVAGQSNTMRTFWRPAAGVVVVVCSAPAQKRRRTVTWRKFRRLPVRKRPSLRSETDAFQFKDHAGNWNGFVCHLSGGTRQRHVRNINNRRDGVRKYGRGTSYNRVRRPSAGHQRDRANLNKSQSVRPLQMNPNVSEVWPTLCGHCERASYASEYELH